MHGLRFCRHRKGYGPTTWISQPDRRALRGRRRPAVAVVRRGGDDLRVRHCTVWTLSERDAAVPERESGPGLDPGPRLKRAPAYQAPHRMGSTSSNTGSSASRRW